MINPDFKTEAGLIRIGTVRSPLQSISECPLQENENAPGVNIEILPGFREGMKDIVAGDQLILLTWLDRADRSELVTHPRNDPNAKLTGVFSTRSPNRPNPIGIHYVKVVDVIADMGFEVDGLEVLDGTPVLDVKPDLQNERS